MVVFMALSLSPVSANIVALSMQMQPFKSWTPPRDLPRFKYTLLKDGEFRLQRFLPGDTLNCELVHVLMGSAPTYYALSYAWGSAEAYENILVNNTHLPVAYSLWTALHSIRAHIREQEAISGSMQSASINIIYPSEERKFCL